MGAVCGGGGGRKKSTNPADEGAEEWIPPAEPVFVPTDTHKKGQDDQSPMDKWNFDQDMEQKLDRAVKRCWKDYSDNPLELGFMHTVELDDRLSQEDSKIDTSPASYKKVLDLNFEDKEEREPFYLQFQQDLSVGSASTSKSDLGRQHTTKMRKFTATIYTLKRGDKFQLVGPGYFFWGHGEPTPDEDKKLTAGTREKLEDVHFEMTDTFPLAIGQRFKVMSGDIKMNVSVDSDISGIGYVERIFKMPGLSMN